MLPKIFIFLISICLITHFSLAQKYTKEKLDVTYTQLPLKPLDQKYKTFKASIDPGNIDFKYIHLNKPLAYIETGSGSNYGSVEKCEKDFLYLPGYDVNEDDPDLLVTMNFNAINVLNKESFTEVRRFFENKEPVDRTCYNYKVTYIYGAAFTFSDKDGNTIYEKIYFDPNEEQTIIIGNPNIGVGDHSFSPAALENEYQTQFLNGYQNDITRDCLMNSRNVLLSDYAYPRYTRRFIIASGKGRKHDYSDLDQAVVLMQEAFTMITSGEEADSKLNAAIEIWDSALSEAQPNEKRARINEKITPMLKINKAIALLWKNDFEEADQLLKETLDRKEGEKFATDIINFNNYYKQRYLACQ
ncbi:MAG TPA: hypothetical protein ACFCUD_14730 [Cyclobacteriaceae bacterium]